MSTSPIHHARRTAPAAAFATSKVIEMPAPAPEPAPPAVEPVLNLPAQQPVAVDNHRPSLEDLDAWDTYDPLPAKHVNYVPVQTVKSHPLDIPADALYGPLADIAADTYAPMSWAYPAALTVFAGKGVNVHDPAPATTPTLMTILLGTKGDGKTTTCTRVAAGLGVTGTDHFLPATPVSDRGWFSLAGEKFKKGEECVPPLVYFTAYMDEFKSFLLKARIEGSTLAPTTCQMFGQRLSILPDKSGKWVMNAQVSILGNLPVIEPSEFSELFGHATGHGLYDRMIICPGPQGWKWDFEFRANAVDLKPWPTEIDKAGHAFLRAYTERREAAGNPIKRVKEVAMRVALISASAAKESIVSIPCLEAAIKFGEWQERVRRVYRIGEAETQEGVVTGAILDAFKFVEDEYEAGRNVYYGPPKNELPIVKEGGWVSWRLLAQKKGWATRWGSAVVTRVRSALVQSGDLEIGWDAGKEVSNHKFRLGAQYHV
jgi:hypothetical protein